MGGNVIVNPFGGAGFEFSEMVAAVNLLPLMYGRIGQLNLMPFRGITTTSLLVEEKNGTLHIVRSRPRGAPGDSVAVDKRKLRSFPVPHLPLDDKLMPEDFQNVREFGSGTSVKTMASVMSDKMQKMKNVLDQTIEYLRIGAAKGIILDADGSTLFNLFTEFSITPLVESFALTDEDSDVRGHCANVIRHIEDNLRGEVMTGVRAFVSSTFFDALVSHPKVEKAYQFYSVNNINLANDYRRSFPFGGITFEEYRARWTDKDGTLRQPIADGNGHAFPEGTMDTFETVCAPGNFNETANTIGLPYYMKQEPAKMGLGVDLHAQSNPLPICKRPGVLVEITA